MTKDKTGNELGIGDDIKCFDKSVATILQINEKTGHLVVKRSDGRTGNEWAEQVERIWLEDERTIDDIKNELEVAGLELAQAVAAKDENMVLALRIIAARLLNEWAEAMAKQIEIGE